MQFRAVQKTNAAGGEMQFGGSLPQNCEFRAALDLCTEVWGASLELRTKCETMTATVMCDDTIAVIQKNIICVSHSSALSGQP